MAFFAEAPGKLVILGEYAVLEGVEAVVMAVDRRCAARIQASSVEYCELTTYAPGERSTRFAAGAPSGVDLADVVTAGLPPSGRLPAWCAAIDSRAFFHDSVKLGLGSSAAALCAFAAAWSAYASAEPAGRALPEVPDLIGLHRRLQGGGSGLDVAASVRGGIITYRLEGTSVPHIGSVQLPKGVGFAGIFAGAPASTPDFVAKFRDWQRQRPRESAGQLDAMRIISEHGCEAIRIGDATGFLAAVRDYGRQLSRLGEKLGRDIVTPEHRRISVLAERYGVTYKVSGAGGGDLGLAFCSDEAALGAFRSAVSETEFVWIDLQVAQQGLSVEEQVW